MFFVYRKNYRVLITKSLQKNSFELWLQVTGSSIVEKIIIRQSVHCNAIMIGNAAFANDQSSTWFWSPIENFGHILTSKRYVGYALVQSISINRASLYALYFGTFHAAQDNIIIVTMQSKIPMRLTATKLLPDKVHALWPAVLRGHASACRLILHSALRWVLLRRFFFFL